MILRIPPYGADRAGLAEVLRISGVVVWRGLLKATPLNLTSFFGLGYARGGTGWKRLYPESPDADVRIFALSMYGDLLGRSCPPPLVLMP